MSKRDYRRDARRLREFDGKRCFISVATNSLKLHLGRRQRSGTFIWIDPPWELSHGSDTVTTSADCPDSAKKSQEARFSRWCTLFAPLYRTTLASAVPKSDGSLTLHFAGGYELFTPSHFIPHLQKLWYDHWYVSRSRKPNHRVERTAASHRASQAS